MDRKQIVDKLARLPVPEVRYFETTGSTNAQALAWAAAVGPAQAGDGCLVVANQQTQGRGRLGRIWITQPDSALAFSLILKPDAEETARIGLFTALGALAVAQALEDSLDLRVAIKWPNDVLLQNRKCAGILVEADWSGERASAVVIGIGINVGAGAVPPADTLLYPAISVEEAANHPVDRLELLQAVIQRVFAWRGAMRNSNFMQAWQKRLAFMGEWVQVQQSAQDAQPVTGQVTGLSDEGGLLLRGKDGQVLTISTGDVRLRPL